jgi:DNA-binding transcriptional LysR family regulator
MDWDDVRHFLALARTGSVRAAGAALNVSHSTVARRVEALEARLATRLFDRSRDGYTLTDAGRQMRLAAEDVERQMTALERALVGQDDRLAGPVAITCSDASMSSILMPALTALCTTHPGIELSLTIDSRPFDLAKREADIAVRALASGATPPDNLVGQKVAPVVLANYVARAHEDRLDPGLGGSDTRFLSFDDRATQDAMIARSSYPDVPAWGAFGSLDLLAQAALEGLGLVMLPTYVGERVPGLRRLEHADLRHVADFWLLSHPDLRDNARIRSVRSGVAQVLKDHGALFRGA